MVVIQTRHANRTEQMLNPTPGVHPPNAEDEGAPSLQDLFDSEESPLLRYAFSLTGRRAVAEEIVQDVFLQLHARFNEVESPKAWLMRSVRNKAFDYLRRKKREVIDGEPFQASLKCSEDQSPEEQLLQMEAACALRRIVDELSTTDKQLVKLKYFDNLKYGEISDQTGLSIGNVGYRLHHILKQLAGKLSQLGIDGMS